MGNNPRPSGDTIYYQRINTYLNETSHWNCSFEGFTCVLPLHDSIQGRQRVIYPGENLTKYSKLSLSPNPKLVSYRFTVSKLKKRFSCVTSRAFVVSQKGTIFLSSHLPIHGFPSVKMSMRFWASGLSSPSRVNSLLRATLRTRSVRVPALPGTTLNSWLTFSFKFWHCSICFL